MISYVITVYNKEEYLHEVLMSIRNQSPSMDCEYIIVNDGSTDFSLKRILEATNQWDNLRIINQKNSGVVEATIAGIEATNGKYIKFVDGDDRLEPNLVQEQCTILETHPDLAFVSCSYGVKRDNKSIPRFASKLCLSKAPLQPSEVEIHTGYEALLHVLTRDTSPTEALTGMSGGLSRRDAINLPLIRSLANKHELRHLQDHLITACSITHSSGFAFIKRIGFSELSKSTSMARNSCLSGKENYSRTLREQALINLSFMEKIPPETQLRLLRATSKILLKANYGKVGLGTRIIPSHPYNKIKRGIKTGNINRLGSLQEKLLEDLNCKFPS